ncbi:MAG: PspA/IM30 family protein [Bernardetiaceae bacterium]|jgi:phage shock protein A|nr:PspA/IM30 family protein [Bernardetiaceae bacterium]
MSDFFKKISEAGKSLLGRKTEPELDPVVAVEQAIAELRAHLGDNIKSLAEIKALYVRTKHEHNAQKKLALAYEQKAIQLLEKARDGQLAPTEADRLASLALAKKQEILNRAATADKGLANYETVLRQLESSVGKQRAQLEAMLTELHALKARAKISQVSRTIHERLARLDSTGTNALLDTLRDKVAEQEALAESYTALAGGTTLLDEEINRALGEAPGGPVNADLQRLKAQLGLPKLPPG